MSKVSIEAAKTPDAVEVDLWGAAFTLLPATRDVLKKGEELAKALQEEGEDSDPDVEVESYAQALDLRLKAVNGGGKASTQIRKKWKANELTIDQLEQFVNGLREAERPT